MSEWVREVLLNQRGSADGEDVILAELMALRVIVINIVSALAQWQGMTREKITELIRAADKERFRHANEKWIEVANHYMGRLIGTTTEYSFLPGTNFSNSYGYDAASNRTSFTAPDGSTNTYQYDHGNYVSYLHHQFQPFRFILSRTSQDYHQRRTFLACGRAASLAMIDRRGH